MSQSFFPEKITLTYKFPLKASPEENVEIDYYSNGKIVFTKPPKLCGTTVTTLFVATMEARKWLIGRDNPCSVFHYWTVQPPHDEKWTPFTFEKYIYTKPVNMIPEPPEAEETSTKTTHAVPVHPFQIPSEKWNSRVVLDWIEYVRANASKTPDLEHIPLLEITHFRRIGLDCLFEFLCCWQTPHGPVKTWQKLAHLMTVKAYWQYICERWNVQDEKEKHFEEEHRIHDEDMLVAPWCETDGYSNWDACAAYKCTEEERKLQKFHESITKQKKRKRSERGRKKSYKNDEDDDDDPNSSGSFSTESDEEEKKTVLKSTVSEPEVPVSWESIFSQTSCDSLPHFRVKVFPKHRKLGHVE